MSTEFHFIAKNVFSVLLSGALRCKILHKILSLVCQLLSLSFLDFSGKALDTVVQPNLHHPVPCRQTLCKALSQALMFLPKGLVWISMFSLIEGNGA